MKLAVVVQRYGLSISGGAELHARYIAEHLARHVQVEIITTCASDYVSWKNEFQAGTEEINGLTVRRFRVAHQRDPDLFGRRSHRVFETRHTLADELAWLDAEGPSSPALIRFIARHTAQYDYWIFFSYRYYHAYHGIRAAGSRAILVPTAERDSALGVSIFKPLFRGVRALMYNSPEERAMIQSLANNHDVTSVVVGVGSEIPPNPQPERFRQKYDVRDPFAIYVGRIDENKGCTELFECFDAYRSRAGTNLSLVLIGQPLLTIPRHPHIRHVGFIDDQDKFDAIAAAEVLLMPSRFESLSMVMLEAWALGRPALVNGTCDVLKGQCLRSNAGLYYEGVAEFVESLCALEQNHWLTVALGRNGRRYFRTHYDWPVIERKYLRIFQDLGQAPATGLEPLPGWLTRRRVWCPPASAVVTGLPPGPVDVPKVPGRPRTESARVPFPKPPAIESTGAQIRHSRRGKYRVPRRGAHKSTRTGGR